MEAPTQLATAINGAQTKSDEIINETSYKFDGSVNCDSIKPGMNANGDAIKSKDYVHVAALPKTGNGGNGKPRGPSKAQQMNKLYSFPTPLRTFPLPTFVPHNPISLVQFLYTWLQQTITPPSSHPQDVYQGVFSPELRSVHVTDQRSIRALWQEGFFGKGSLSRSEPSWLDREKRKIGASASKTSEEVTRQRRAERQQAKWERARIEREAIDRRLREERESGILPAVAVDDKSQSTPNIFLPPVGPQELVRLPNSQYDLDHINDTLLSTTIRRSHITSGLSNEIVVPNGQEQHLKTITTVDGISNGDTNSTEHQIFSAPEVDLLLRPLHRPVAAIVSGDIEPYVSANSDTLTGEEQNQSKILNRKKSVRFSPTIEQTTFLPSDPISTDVSKSSPAPSESTDPKDITLQIQDQEHLQLTMEEAFFLSYGLGVLTILDSHTHSPIPRQDLLPLFRRSSYFPTPLVPRNRPDDPFLLSYVVYHHFRSLGWCVRGGTKFGVDYLLYNRGPVFSHAEFAILILPSYSHSYWSSNAAAAEDIQKRQSHKWSWLHCINRVNSQVKKTVVLVYVDVPPPVEEEGMRVDEMLARYKVREVVLRRWVSNRSRD